MAVAELSNYTLKPVQRGNGINDLFFSVFKGDIWSINPAMTSDAHLLINGLATLSYPENGEYMFNGIELDFSDYRMLLSAKKRIGYLSPDAALISNRTIRENLSLGKAYFENDLSFSLDQQTLEMCAIFEIDRFIENRPVNLGTYDQRKAMVVREIMKKPDFMLIEYPEEFVDEKGMTRLTEILNHMIKGGMAMVYLSYDKDFLKAFSGVKTVSV